MPDKDDFIHLHATDQTIALDFRWTLSRRCGDGGAVELDYQDADCRCRLRIDRLDLAQPRTGVLRVRREWLVVLSGSPSPERIDAIIARIDRVLRWPVESGLAIDPIACSSGSVAG